MKISTPPLVSLLRIILFISSIFSAHAAGDTINQTQSIRDGETLVSKGNIFALGFFHGGNGSSTENRYLGIWYTFSPDTVAWVANRESPVADSSGVLQLTSDGDLIILQNQKNTTDVVWSTTTTSSSNTDIANPVAKLLDSGNLIITNGADGGLIWQSFDYPSDSLLPGMKLGFDKTTGQQWYMTSWKTQRDPSPGSFACKMDVNGSHEIFGEVFGQIAYRIGPWNGYWFSGLPRMRTYKDYRFTYIDNETTTYYRYDTITPGLYARLMAFPNNTLARVAWKTDTPRWIALRSAADECDPYSKCGPNGVCNPQGQRFCDCYSGFHPKSKSSWNDRDYSEGCERNEELNCSSSHSNGFLLVNNLKLPDTTNSTIHKNISLDSCKLRCSGNCSCTAYAPYYLSGRHPRGCVLWFGDLLDTKVFQQDGQDMYLRLPDSELPGSSGGNKNRAKMIIIIAIMVPALIVFPSFGIFMWMRKKKRERKAAVEREEKDDYEGRHWNDELPLFDFATVSSATSNFSDANVIGRGGFGTVYKGDLLDGEEIAVKRLNSKPTRKKSGGVDEFMNEATLIAKLQHRNLVRLIGCCIQQEERILIYEFMKNRSLDAFIFGESETRAMVDWRRRVEIIMGIGRGLLYLHQDSRLNVIHRDLKAGNVLLDEDMNPKISDFGTARIFEGDEQSEVNTQHVMGTYGYMAPEYAMDGIFSIKSDVFSFGILLLEIISGRKNRRTIYQGDDEYISLPALAWKLWEDETTVQLVDEAIKSTCSNHYEAERYIQIALLCVQELSTDRPPMPSVILMLSSETSPLPKPMRPGFWIERRTSIPPYYTNSSAKTATTSDTDKSSALLCTNEVTITSIDVR